MSSSRFGFVPVHPSIWSNRIKIIKRHQHKRQLIPSKSIKPVALPLIDISCELRTCRNCKQSFDPTKNNPTACRYHDGNYTGDSKRKGEWKEIYESGSGTVERFWWFVFILVYSQSHSVVIQLILTIFYFVHYCFTPGVVERMNKMLWVVE